jgi:membrane protease YdiL (CAAX protease family)
VSQPIASSGAPTSRATSVIRRHPVVAFFVLAYAIAWVGWPLWASGVLAEPLFLPCGPLVAALVVIAVTEGKAGFRVLGARMVRWRVGGVWWAVALGFPIALVLVTALLMTITGAPLPVFTQLAWADLALLFGLYLINPLGGAFGEEPGWRGCALPYLQSTRPAVASALVLGLLIALWHLPLVVFGMLGPIGLLATVAITVVYVWLFNRTGGSVLLTLVAHALQDSFNFGSLGYAAPDLARAEYLYCLVVVVAAALVLIDRPAWRVVPAAATSRRAREGVAEHRG